MSAIENFIKNKNRRKILFPPGPSSLSKENILGLGPFFGKGDTDYLSVEKNLLNKLKKIFKRTKNVSSSQLRYRAYKNYKKIYEKK
tara:strand:- start:854 stop:1111 length:258 start_codon:yes stop_codon:yes gene_type:complete